MSQHLAGELLVASVACEQGKELGEGAWTRGLILGWSFGASGAGLDDLWGSLPTWDILGSKVKKEVSVLKPGSCCGLLNFGSCVKTHEFAP